MTMMTLTFLQLKCLTKILKLKLWMMNTQLKLWTKTTKLKKTNLKKIWPFWSSRHQWMMKVHMQHKNHLSIIAWHWSQLKNQRQQEPRLKLSNHHNSQQQNLKNKILSLMHSLLHFMTQLSSLILSSVALILIQSWWQRPMIPMKLIHQTLEKENINDQVSCSMSHFQINCAKQMSLLHKQKLQKNCQRWATSPQYSIVVELWYLPTYLENQKWHLLQTLQNQERPWQFHLLRTENCQQTLCTKSKFKRNFQRWTINQLCLTDVAHFFPRIYQENLHLHRPWIQAHPERPWCLRMQRFPKILSSKSKFKRNFQRWTISQWFSIAVQQFFQRSPSYNQLHLAEQCHRLLFAAFFQILFWKPLQLQRNAEMLKSHWNQLCP